MSKDPEDEEQKRKEALEASSEQEREFYSESHKSLSNQEIKVFSGGGGTLLNREMFRHFDIDEELAEEEKRKKINEKINDPSLDDAGRKELYDSVRGKVEGALKSGNLKDVDPEPHATDENSVSYKVDGHDLNQTELDGGMFKFAPEGKFTGILRVERRDSNGELLENSADIIEYKDGKPVSVIPGPEGETRVADFGLISQQAGISVSKAQDTGISVSKAKEVDRERGLQKESPAPTASIEERSVSAKSGPLVKGGQTIDQESLNVVVGIMKENLGFDNMKKESQLAFESTFFAVRDGVKSGIIKPIVIKMPEKDRGAKMLGWKDEEKSQSSTKKTLTPEQQNLLDVATVITYSTAFQAFNSGTIKKKVFENVCSEIKSLAPEALHKVDPQRFPIKSAEKSMHQSSFKNPQFVTYTKPLSPSTTPKSTGDKGAGKGGVGQK